MVERRRPGERGLELEQFVELVARMRGEQRRFFATRSSDALAASKGLEAEVDRFLERDLGRGSLPGLFDGLV